jgi:hypothetical protein
MKIHSQLELKTRSLSRISGHPLANLISENWASAHTHQDTIVRMDSPAGRCRRTKGLVNWFFEYLSFPTQKKQMR